MKLLKWLSLLVVMLSTCVIADSGDFVERVYPCNDDVGLRMQNAGWVVAREVNLGEKRVDRILSVGLTLLVTQNPSGFFNPGATIAWCGIQNVRVITVLGIDRAP